MRKNVYTQVMVSNNYEPIFSQVIPDKTPGKGPQVVMVVSTHRTVVRVAKLTKADKRLTPAIQWQLVQENFPIGPLFNGDTHIFDGSVFTNDVKQQSFIMVAIPKKFSESIATAAIENWGSAHRLERLDTIEHVLFRHYTKQFSKESMWIVFPQDNGFRILHLKNGLPENAYNISNHPDMREIELKRIMEASKLTKIITLCGDVDKANSRWLKEFIQSYEMIETVDDMFHEISHYM